MSSENHLHSLGVLVVDPDELQHNGRLLSDGQDWPAARAAKVRIVRENKLPGRNPLLEVE